MFILNSNSGTFNYLLNKTPGRRRIVDFDARPLVFDVNFGGNIEAPSRKILGSYLGHIL